MSRSQDPQRPLFTFGNPFKMMLPKGSDLSPRLLALLNSFEKDLAERFNKLKPIGKEDILSLSWMNLAMELLCQTHADIKNVITQLELPICDWEDKWIDVYLDNSVKLLDICIAFGSELSRLSQGNLFLQCGLHYLRSYPSNPLVRANSSLDSWVHHMCSKNPRLVNCLSILDHLIGTLNLPKIKKSAKGKVLMRAMYGVKVFTVFICSVFAAGLMGSPSKLVDLPAHEACLWAEAFADVQSYVNGEIRNIFSGGKVTALKEVEVVDTDIKKLAPIFSSGTDSTTAEALRNSISELGKSADQLSNGLDLLKKQVDIFFKIVLSGRDALISNLRLGGGVTDQTKGMKNRGQLVR